MFKMLFLLSLLLIVDFSNATILILSIIIQFAYFVFSNFFVNYFQQKFFPAFFKSYFLPFTIVLQSSLSKLLTTSLINESKSFLVNLIHNGFRISSNFSCFNSVRCLMPDLFSLDNDFFLI